MSSWCLVMVERLFLVVQRGCLQFVIVVFPDHTYLVFLINLIKQEHECKILFIIMALKLSRRVTAKIILVSPASILVGE